MSFIPKPHEIYRHFKGNLYQVTAIAEHTETGELLVVYQALYGDFRTYARPLAMFTQRLDREKYPDADQEFRFELQGPEGARQRKESDAPAPAMSMADGSTSKVSGGIGGEEPTEAELALDPMVLEFLDADTYEQRLNIMAGLHHRITDDMLTTMAIACDVEVGEGGVEERYEALKNCLVTMQRYECNRLNR